MGIRSSLRSSRRGQQGLAYAGQMVRRPLHRFDPWGDQFSIGHAVRSRECGILVAGEIDSV